MSNTGNASATFLTGTTAQTESIDPKFVPTGQPTPATVQDEGNSLTVRSKIDFQGAGVTVTDDSASGKTIVTIPGGSGGHTIQDEGTSVTQRDTLNFVGGGVTVTDAGGKTVVTIPTQATGTNTGDVTLGAVGSAPNANGATLSGQSLNLEPASASYPGVVTTGTQTIAGAKTFSGSPVTVLSASAASQSPLVIKTTGVVGSGPLLSTNPEFKLQQFVGGIGAAELQFKHKSDEFTERSLMEVESTGTLATIADDGLRAHYEAYTHGLQNGHAGSYKPVMRLSSYPYMQFQAGPGASMAVAGDVTRSGSTVTVTLSTAAYEHGFSVGDPLYITGGESGWTFSEGTLTVGAVLAWNSFSYTDSSATATVNTGPILFTIEPDVTVGRSGAKALDVRTDVVNNPSNYSARFTPSAVTIPSNVTLTVQGPLNANGSVGTSGYVLTSQGAGSPPQWAAASGGSTGHTIQDEGSSLTARSILNFVGGAITASDDGVSKTLVTVLPASTSQEGVVTTGAQDFGGRKGFPGTPVNTDASYTVASIDQLQSFVKNDSNTRVFYGTRVKPTFNFGASNANTTVTALEVSSTDTNVTGLTHVIANFAKNDGSKFKVMGSGELQLADNGGTNGQVLTSAGPGAQATWTTPAATHDALTLGTAAGLSLAGQVLSVDPVQMLSKGDSAGSPGDATLNTYAGRSAIASGATSCTITCNKVVAGTFVFVQPISHWGAMMGQHYVTSTAGSFTVNLTGTAGGTLYFDWHLH